MHSTKSRGVTRRVWRMTAENQLGEILELSDEPNAGRFRQGARSPGSPSKQPVALALFHDSIGFAPRSTGKPFTDLSTWRASSYDLLQGLVVRDVSEKIPQRTFEALFSADATGGQRR
jgi:hypothetical protein